MTQRCDCGEVEIPAGVDVVKAPVWLPAHTLAECPDPKGCEVDGFLLTDGARNYGTVNTTHTASVCLTPAVKTVSRGEDEL